MTQITFKKEQANKYIARIGAFGGLFDDANIIVEYDDNYNEWFFTLDLYIDNPVNKDRWTQLYNIPFKTKSECQVAALNLLEKCITICKDPTIRAMYLNMEV